MTTLRGNDAIFADNDSCITLVLTDKDGFASTGGVASVTIQKDGADVGGETWPLSMAETATLGTYEAVIKSTVAIVAGDKVSVRVNATSSIGEKYQSLNPSVDVINRPLDADP